MSIQSRITPKHTILFDLLDSSAKLAKDEVTAFLGGPGCGCTKGPDGQSCLKQLNETDIRDFRLSCFELDYMVENENRLNVVIVAELSALLHQDDKLMYSHSRFKSQKERKKQLFPGLQCLYERLFVSSWHRTQAT